MFRGGWGREELYYVAMRKRSDNRVTYGLLAWAYLGPVLPHGVKRFTLIDIKNQ